MSTSQAGPSRPPQSVAGAKDPFEGWSDVPLFMKSLPASQGGLGNGQADDGGIEGNATLEALQSLMYDGDASEVADGLKKQGNDLFKLKKYKDAIGFYTRAIDEVGKDLPIEERRTLWCNRAAANLELGNYGTCLRDLSLVLSAPLASADPPSKPYLKTTQKALLRSARALKSLDKFKEALDALDRLKLLEIELGEEAEDVGKKVREETEGLLRRKEKREKEKEEKERRSNEGEKRLKEALVMRGFAFPKPKSKTEKLFSSCPIDVPPPHFDPDSLPAESRPSLPLLPSSDSDTSFIRWEAPPTSTPFILPTFLLLPLASPPTRDLCLELHYQSTFGDFLLSMEHDPSTLNVYLATTKGKLLKVGNKLTLERVLDAIRKDEADFVELKEGWAIEMVGVPKGEKGDKWVKEWKDELSSKASGNAIL